jgi:hypothetical protein
MLLHRLVTVTDFGGQGLADERAPGRSDPGGGVVNCLQ